MVGKKKEALESPEQQVVLVATTKPGGPPPACMADSSPMSVGNHGDIRQLSDGAGATNRSAVVSRAGSTGRDT